MTDAISQLASLLKEAGLRPVFDPSCSAEKPCIECGSVSVPRDLVTVGHYIVATRGGILPRDRMVRPVCPDCIARLPQWTSL